VGRLAVSHRPTSRTAAPISRATATAISADAARTAIRRHDTPELSRDMAPQQRRFSSFDLISTFILPSEVDNPENVGCRK